MLRIRLGLHCIALVMCEQLGQQQWKQQAQFRFEYTACKMFALPDSLGLRYANK